MSKKTTKKPRSTANIQAKPIPKQLNIKGTLYQVKIIDGLIEEQQVLWGKCDIIEKIIYLEKSQSPFNLYQTFLHEVVHAILSEIGANLTMPLEFEEVICESISMDMAKLLLC